MPKQGTARLQKALTNLSILYKNSDFIFGDVLKDLPVQKDTDKYHQGKKTREKPKNNYQAITESMKYGVGLGNHQIENNEI